MHRRWHSGSRTAAGNAGHVPPPYTPHRLNSDRQGAGEAPLERRASYWKPTIFRTRWKCSSFSVVKNPTTNRRNSIITTTHNDRQAHHSSNPDDSSGRSATLLTFHETIFVQFFFIVFRATTVSRPRTNGERETNTYTLLSVSIKSAESDVSYWTPKSRVERTLLLK